jgi:hypothetical protein
VNLRRIARSAVLQDQRNDNFKSAIDLFKAERTCPAALEVTTPLCFTATDPKQFKKVRVDGIATGGNQPGKRLFAGMEAQFNGCKT